MTSPGQVQGLLVTNILCTHRGMHGHGKGDHYRGERELSGCGGGDVIRSKVNQWTKDADGVDGGGALAVEVGYCQCQWSGETEVG